jgi:LysM repeat protein
MSRTRRKIGARVALCALAAAAVGIAGCTNRQPFREPAQHRVQSGETLGWIARGYGVKPERLARANGLREGDQPAVGRKLWIPDGGRITHRVQTGETIGAIARHYRVRTSEIVSVNRLGRFGRIEPGTWLVMPRAATLPPPGRTLIAREAARPVRARPAPLPSVSANRPRAPAAVPEPSLARAEALVEEATERYRTAHFELALESAREAEALLAQHANARAARELGARAAFVAGSAHAGLGERERAVDSYARVRALDPDFEPPPGWLSPRLEALYLEARAE